MKVTAIALAFRLLAPAPTAAPATVEPDAPRWDRNAEYRLAFDEAKTTERNGTSTAIAAGVVASIAFLGATAAHAHALNVAKKCSEQMFPCEPYEVADKQKRDRTAITAFAVIGGMSIAVLGVGLIVRAVGRKRQRKILDEVGGRLMLRF